MSGAAGQPPSTNPPTRHRAPDDGGPLSARQDVETGDHDVRSRREKEKDRFGGIKVGCAFFGWLAATGLSVVLLVLLAILAILAGIGAVVADARGTTASDITADPASAAIAGTQTALAPQISIPSIPISTSNVTPPALSR